MNKKLSCKVLWRYFAFGLVSATLWSLGNFVSAQTVDTYTANSGFEIAPPGTSPQVQMNLFATPPAGSTTPSNLFLQNLFGDIDLSLPASGAQFGVYKPDGMGGLVSLLSLVPGATGGDAFTVNANTSLNGTLSTTGDVTITGTLTVSGALGLPGAVGNIGTSLNGGVNLGGSGNSLSSALATVIGGQSNQAAGYRSAILGGTSNTVGSSGTDAVVIGGGYNTNQANEAGIFGSWNSTIWPSNAAYAVLTGGSGNQIGTSGGSANTGTFSGIFGGASNQVQSGMASVILGGMTNSISSNEYNQAILAGESNSQGTARDSVVLGGQGNSIQSYTDNNYSYNRSVIAGGVGNTLGANTKDSAIIASEYSTVSGDSNIAIGASGSQATGGFSVVFGYGTNASGWNQVVFGHYNAVDTNQAFIIGGGSSSTALLNLFTVDWSGNVNAGSLNVTNTISASQGARFDGPVRIAPSGGLSMGSYTYDPNAQ